jgi:hypothetical protein
MALDPRRRRDPDALGLGRIDVRPPVAAIGVRRECAQAVRCGERGELVECRAKRACIVLRDGRPPSRTGQVLEHQHLDAVRFVRGTQFGHHRPRPLRARNAFGRDARIIGIARRPRLHESAAAVGPLDQPARRRRVATLAYLAQRPGAAPADQLQARRDIGPLRAPRRPCRGHASTGS